VNTLIKPHIPSGSRPSRDDDPTGVRALLSALPEPDHMPEHLVERINASLAAEQAQRATQTSGTPVLPLLARRRSRPARLVMAIAGTAAAVALAAVVGNTMLTPGNVSVTSSAGIASTPKGDAHASAQPGPEVAAPAAGTIASDAITAAQIRISLSETRYTKAGFVTQAQAFSHAPLPDQFELRSAAKPSAGAARTTDGLIDCLGAIGAAKAQAIRADIAFYEGRPALIIVATTHGRPVAFAVSRQCSHTDALVLRKATPLS
jgi:hypothetical protein